MHERNQASIQVFTDYLRYEKRYSPHTVRAYHDDLQQFFSFLSSQYELHSTEAILPVYIKSWLASLKEQDMESRSVSRKISVLRSFFRFQLRQGLLSVSPMAGITVPKIRKRLPQYVNQPDMKTLLRDVEFSGGFSGSTEKLIIALFYHTGVRVSELIRLTDQQVSFSGHTLRILGKGNKERLVPVSPGMLQMIREYINLREAEFPGRTSATLLVTPRGNALYAKSVYLIVKKYLSLVTTIEKRSPHILRHSFATHLMNNGADLNAVKELLGHSSLAATQVYTHTTISKLQEIHKKAHPKG